MGNKYTLDDRISDLCLLENYVSSKEAVEVIVSMIAYLQEIQDYIIPEMKDCIGAGGQYLDDKLNDWINLMK